MTNKHFFPIKYKMLTAYGFHIDFQFLGQKLLPRDLWMAQTPLWQFLRASMFMFEFFLNFLLSQALLNKFAGEHECPF